MQPQLWSRGRGIASAAQSPPRLPVDRMPPTASSALAAAACAAASASVLACRWAQRWRFQCSRGGRGAPQAACAHTSAAGQHQPGAQPTCKHPLGPAAQSEAGALKSGSPRPPPPHSRRPPPAPGCLAGCRCRAWGCASAGGQRQRRRSERRVAGGARQAMRQQLASLGRRPGSAHASLHRAGGRLGAWARLGGAAAACLQVVHN